MVAIPDVLRPYLKAVTPAALGVATILLSWLSSGELDGPGLEVGLTAVAAASVTYLVAEAPDGWRRFAKSIAPALVTIAALLAHFLVTGDLSVTDARIAVAGLLSAAIAGVVPNDPHTKLPVEVDASSVADEDFEEFKRNLSAEVGRARRENSAELAPPSLPRKRGGER